MPRALIIGMGNPLRGDDGLGWHVIERLRGLAAEDGADLLACHQLTPELAAPVAQSKRVIFIDAAEGEPAGEVRVERIDAVNGLELAPDALSHCLDPPALVRYAKTLYGRVPEAILVSVKGSAYGFSETLSEAAMSAVPEVVRLVDELLSAGRQGPGMEGTCLPV